MYFLHYFSRITGCGTPICTVRSVLGDHAAEKAVSFGGNCAGDLMNGVADYLNTKYAVIAAQNFPGTVLQNHMAEHRLSGLFI